MSKKILIADDDAELVSLYTRVLARSGFVIVTARDGEEAIALADAEKPDLILVDIGMPKKDGFEFSKTLRSFYGDWGKNVPIMILTGHEIEETGLKEIMKIEPTYYIMKASESMDTIVSKIEGVLA